jgi:hypothetical protein
MLEDVMAFPDRIERAVEVAHRGVRMSVIAVLALVQKLLPAKAAVDVPLALAIVGLWHLDRPRAVIGFRLGATDVRRYRRRGPGHAVGQQEKDKKREGRK